MKNLVAQTSSFKMALKENNKNMDHLVSSDCFNNCISHKNGKADTCTSESVYVCFQAQGRRPSSGCWPVGSGLTEEVSLSLSQMKPD